MLDRDDIIIEISHENDKHGILVIHKKTGASVLCTSEKDYFSNKALAMQQLEEVLNSVYK